MKRFFTLFGLFTFLLMCANNIYAQRASFSSEFLQEDYRGGEVVRTNTVNVTWDDATGVLTINNFYSNEMVNDQVVNLVIPSYATDYSSPTTLTWESETKANFTWRAYSMGQSDLFEGLPFSYASFRTYKAAVVSRFQHVNSAVRMYDPETNTLPVSCYYAYYGGQDCHGTIDLEAGTIDITDPWGCVIGNNTWNNMSASVVIEYFESSHMTRVNTGIENVNANAQVVNTRYYNSLGVESSEPFNGLNIIVKEYSNGQKTTSKQIMR